MSRGRVAVIVAALCVTAAGVHAERGPRAAKVENSIRGATQMFVAPWGLAAQGSGQLRVLPLGKTKWETIRQVPHGSLYRIAFDDAGRLLAWWENEADIHLFVIGTKKDERFALPAAPGPEFKYGFGVEDMYFAADGKGAIVYMHGFVGGRTWETVAYHYDLVGGAPTMLFRQQGHVLHTSARAAVHAMPKDPSSMCEHTACHPLGAIIAWEIAGTKATKRVLLDGNARKEDFSRVDPVWGGDGREIAVLVTEHPHGRHLLRWTWGDAKATLTPIAEGPGYDPEWLWIAGSGDVVEVWLNDERGLEIRRHPVKGDVTVTTLAPHPKRTAHDHPLFGVDSVGERANGDLLVHWGEFLEVVPVSGKARQLDLRSVFQRKTEFTGRLLHVRSPEGTWVGIESGKNLDFTFLPQAQLDARMSPAP
jgi:hypothetical protein